MITLGSSGLELAKIGGARRSPLMIARREGKIESERKFGS
jgi:hypothetical protein